MSQHPYTTYTRTYTGTYTACFGVHPYTRQTYLHAPLVRTYTRTYTTYTHPTYTLPSLF